MFIKRTLWNPWPGAAFEISVPKKVLSAFARVEVSPEALRDHSAGARKGPSRSLRTALSDLHQMAPGAEVRVVSPSLGLSCFDFTRQI